MSIFVDVLAHHKTKQELYFVSRVVFCIDNAKVNLKAVL